MVRWISVSRDKFPIPVTQVYIIYGVGAPSPICLYAERSGVRYLEIFCEYGQLAKAIKGSRDDPFPRAIPLIG